MKAEKLCIGIIDEMLAGRELDVLIATKVMGFEFPSVMGGSDLADFYIRIPLYSTDISAAWQVVRKIWPPGTFNLTGVQSGRCRVDFARLAESYNENQYFRAYADTAQLAICQAALKVVMNGH